MDKLVKHGIRMLEIVEGENDFFRNDAKRQADIARAVYDTILRVQVLERKFDKDINVRNKDEPKTQTKTQNSNLTFEKRTMRDCYNCERYETEDECIECHYEPKDECAKEYEELGLKELKELIKADRKDEPLKTADYCDICKQDMCKDCIADATNPYCVPSHYEINYEPKDEPQNHSGEVTEMVEPQTDCAWMKGE